MSRGRPLDVDRAVAAARKAYEGEWRLWTPAQRQRLLYRIGEAIYDRAEEFAQLEALDNGKSVVTAKNVDVSQTAEMFMYYAGWATKLEGTTMTPSVSVGTNLQSLTLREPIGVVGAIVPWNFPLMMAAFKVPVALATGNTIVLKPSEQTPLTALLLAEVMAEAGTPDGVFNVVTGFADAGARLAEHHGVDKIAFTGSVEVGKKIIEAAKGNLKKVSLELGSKSPQVVYADADLEAAIPGTVSGAMFNLGQNCCAGSRLLVEDRIFDEFIQGFAEMAKTIKVGSGLDPATDMGPLISEKQLDRVAGYVEQGLRDGAQAVTGGSRLDGDGYFMEPTVLVDVEPSFSVYREEIFGPVVVATPFSADRGVQAAANDTPYGLAASVWTRDVSKAIRTAQEIKAGTVWINTHNVLDVSVPFGGYKQSGWGRELGRQSIEEYTQLKTVTIQL